MTPKPQKAANSDLETSIKIAKNKFGFTTFDLEFWRSSLQHEPSLHPDLDLDEPEFYETIFPKRRLK